MAENSLSVGHLTRNKKNTFTKQDVKRSRAMHLQLYLLELKDRERRAQEHNSQLLQQFEEAQDVLKEMLARTAAMKTIRMEYDRYLEDNSSRWQQQLREQTQAAQSEQRTDDSLKACLKKTEENQVLGSTVGRPLISQGPSNQKSVQACSTQEKSDYHQDNSSNHPYTRSSWLTSSFLTASHQSHNPLLPPPPTVFHPHSFLPQHFPSTPSHHQPWLRQDDAGGDPGTTPEEPNASRVPQTGEKHEETSRVRINHADGGSRSRLSPDLDIKPVRLLSGRAESSESDRDSSLVSRPMKKRGRTQRSDSDSHGSQKASNKTASFLPQCSGSDTCSEENSTVPVVSEEEAEIDEEEESQRTDEEEGSSDQESPGEKVEDQSESCAAEQESGRSNRTRAEEETDDQEQSIKEKDGDGQKNPGPGDREETENSQSEEEEDDDDEDVCTTGKTEEEAEVRMEEQGEDEEQKQGSASSQDEDRRESSEDEEKKQGSASSQDEDRRESSEDEEGSCDEDQGEESGDSEDVIIPPQIKRPEQIQIISEEAEEDEENKTQSSDEVSDDDIEDLLAPREQTEEKELKTDEEPKVIYHNMDIFQVMEKSKTDDKSDSEFDHFYD